MIARKLRKFKNKGFVFSAVIIGIIYLAKDMIYPSYDSLKSEDKEVEKVEIDDSEYKSNGSVSSIQKSKEDDVRKEINPTNEEDDNTKNNTTTEDNPKFPDHKKTINNNQMLLGTRMTNMRFSHSEATSDYDIKTILSTMKLQQSDGGQFTPMWNLSLKGNARKRLEVRKICVIILRNYLLTLGHYCPSFS